MAEHSIFEMIKSFALLNIPFLMDKGTMALQESKKRVTEYSLKQKIKNNYKKIGQLIYKNKIKINDKSVKCELDKIAECYLDIKNNDNIIAKLDK